MAAWAEEGGLDGVSVAEIGGGIGQLQAELVRRGAARGQVVEVVSEYEPVAAELARAIEIDDRTSFVLADLFEAPDALAPADIVVLRRVVCCTPDGPELLGVGARKTRRTLLASYPRGYVLSRMLVSGENAILRLLRKRFRVFAHDPRELERAVSQHGLHRARVSRGLVWETAQFEHAPSS